MYNYPHYKEPDKTKLIEFMCAHPFITLIGCDNKGRIEATQIPVLIEEKGDRLFIFGHIAKKSDHHYAFEENPNVLAIFTGAHSYVSGTWYSGNPHQASTWNYISIHARGQIKFLDESFLIELLKKLSLHFENNNTASSTIYDNLPVDYKEKLIKAILAFEIEVTEMDNVFKLSQNRDEKSYDSIVQQLKQKEGDAKQIGELMEKRKDQVFK
ncbi:MAG TPA: FMN-binding negative transcriptional regulator [Chitinophagaceae bacterium]|jgi:transcriptional regulator|nr:FMN-binding negative transcriptional regulator [Chitinophagaceae bacterium]